MIESRLVLQPDTSTPSPLMQAWYHHSSQIPSIPFQTTTADAIYYQLPLKGSQNIYTIVTNQNHNPKPLGAYAGGGASSSFRPPTPKLPFCLSSSYLAATSFAIFIIHAFSAMLLLFVGSAMNWKKLGRGAVDEDGDVDVDTSDFSVCSFGREDSWGEEVGSCVESDFSRSGRYMDALGVASISSGRTSRTRRVRCGSLPYEATRR